MKPTHGNWMGDNPDFDYPEPEDVISELECDCGAQEWQMTAIGIIVCVDCGEPKPWEPMDPIPIEGGGEE